MCDIAQTGYESLEKMTTMRVRRLLFASPRYMAGLAPIYFALLSLVSLSLLGFAVAFWAEDPAPSAYRQDHNQAAPAGRASEGGQHSSPDSRAPRIRTTWM